jgi:hypothetical protein
MKLEKILDTLSTLDKTSFVKIIEYLAIEATPVKRQLDNLYNQADGQLKNADSINLVKVYHLVENSYLEYLKSNFNEPGTQIDILTDVLIRDGNCIMSREWLGQLYEKEIKEAKKKIGIFKGLMNDENAKGIDIDRLRDYTIYRNCVNTAYFNDVLNNQSPKITTDEQTILETLSKNLELSQEEARLLNYMVIPLEKLELDIIIKNLKDAGIILYSKKDHLIYVPDEVVLLLRKIKGKELADKNFRRVLANMKESQINLICKKHNIDWRGPLNDKIRRIINQGVKFSTVISNVIYKPGTSVSAKKNYINNFAKKELRISSFGGKTIPDKIQLIIDYFQNFDSEAKVSISFDGYEKLLRDLELSIPKINQKIKSEFELQEDYTLNNKYLLDFNIKPSDVLYLLDDAELNKFCIRNNVKTRGDKIENILESYKEAENIFLENYDKIGARDLKALKENGIHLKDSELGLKFEDLTKVIFSKLGFNVAEKLRKKINTKKNKIDILIDLSNNEVMIIECKSVKGKDFNKYSTVSRQIKSYIELAEKKGLRVIKSLLIAPEFSDQFEKECGLELELNLSLITGASLKKIYEGFKDSTLDIFPYKLLLRDVVIKEDRILTALGR